MRIAVGVLIVAAVAGCGHSASLPAACTNGPGAVLKALEQAPGAVTIDGTPISECFKRTASSDDVQIVGTNLLAAAQRLGDRARAGDGTAALRLGYLIGAAKRGVKQSGVADELVRRLQAETTVAAVTRSAYDRGLRAGQARG